jgi:phenylalanyl-tRNA synthetase beta chain
MIGLGFEEAICNILTDIASIRQQMNLTAEAVAPLAPFLGPQTVAIANVMNLNYGHLRDWLLPSLLEIESHSGGALYPHCLFEVGEVAVFDPVQNLGSRTESRLGALIAADDASFDSAQSAVYALLNSLDVTFTIAPWSHASFIGGRIARILLGDGLPIGFLGELAPQVITNWGGRTPIAAFELSLSTLYEKVRKSQVQETMAIFA